MIETGPAILVMCLVGAVLHILLVIDLKGKGDLSLEAQEAIRILLEEGCCIEKNGVHLYKSGKKTYELLYFDGKGNLKPNTDESFTDPEDAIQKFARRTMTGVDSTEHDEV